MNYFALLCFFWAGLGIISRVAMAIMGKRWKEWELKNAYSEKRPGWLYIVTGFGLALIISTWIMVILKDIPHSWIIAALITVTAVKLGMFMFRYNEFRDFVSRILSDRPKMAALNTVVLVFSAGLIAMGVFLY